MQTGQVLRRARSRAGMTQRELARRSGVAQSTIARIEAGHVDPSVSTLTTLLAPCGVTLDVAPLLGAGVDRSQIARRLAMTPRQRIDELQRAAASIAAVRRGRRVG